MSKKPDPTLQVNLTSAPQINLSGTPASATSVSATPLSPAQEPLEQEEVFALSEEVQESVASSPTPESIILNSIGAPQKKKSSSSSRSPLPVKREEVRPTLHMDYADPASVPPHLRQEGYSYRWVRKSTDGIYDSRIAEMSQKGWEPVVCDATHKHHDPLGRDPDASRFVCYKDVILMKRPRIFSQREDEALAARHTAIMNSLKHLEKEVELEPLPYEPNWNF